MGLAFHDGTAIFIPRVLPGERVKAVITGVRRDYCMADAVEVMEPSPARIDPPCPIYEKCGGCDILHATYEAEIALKKDILDDCMARIGGFPSGSYPQVETVLGERHGYRSHALLHASGGTIGFYGKESRDIIQIPEQGCLLLSPAINDAIRGKRFAAGSSTDMKIAENLDGRIVQSGHADRLVREEVNGWIFDRNVEHFFQANRHLRPLMQERVCMAARSGDMDSVADIGCGVGFFTMPLAGMFRFARGYDLVKDVIAMARRNARANNAENTDFTALPASRIHPGRISGSTIVVDPPRAGLSIHARNTILAIAPPVIAYVSCNPATFSRDLRRFCGSGYSIESIVLFDMFPCTAHMEILARLARGDGSAAPGKHARKERLQCGNDAF